MRNGRKCLGVLALACCLLLSGCAQQAAEQEVPVLLEPAGVELDYAQAQMMDLCTIITYSSAVVPYVEEMHFTVDGTVEDVLVTLGSSVKKGDTLITLNQETLLEEEAERIAELSYTRSIYANDEQMQQIDLQIASLQLEEMKNSGADAASIASAQADIDMAELKMRQEQEQHALELAKLEEKLAKLQEKIGQNELVAPFDGIIVAMDDLRAEYSVTAYDTVIQIADESRLQLSGDFISETYVRGAHEIYALIGDRKYALEAVAVDMTEYLTTIFAGGTLHTRFDFVGEHDDVSCGDYAAICVVTGYVENALAVPCNALYSDSAGRYVYRLAEDGTRVRVNVHTGLSNSLYIQITEGLEEGDSVYVKE